MKHTHGFTLLEILIAILIIAIAFTAILKCNQSSIKQFRRLKQKTIAQWVAINAYNKLKLGIKDTKQSAFHQIWDWQVNQKKTENSYINEISVTVYQSKIPVYTLHSFIWKPHEKP